MFTYTSARNLLGKLTSDSSVDNLTTMDALHNEACREVITIKPWKFREKTLVKSTVALQQYYYIGQGRVRNVTVTIGTTQYKPFEVKTSDEWNKLNEAVSYSNTPEAYFVGDGKIGFYPIPSSLTVNAITANIFQGHKDLTIADYTTGTITTTTLGGNTITGSSTAWTASMAGRWIRITESNTDNNGDGKWYEISSVESATSLTLLSPYEGTSITAGTAPYTIGQTSIIPEDFQLIPLHRATENYFTFIQPDDKRATKAKALYAEGLKRMQVEAGSTTI